MGVLFKKIRGAHTFSQLLRDGCFLSKTGRKSFLKDLLKDL